MKTTISALAVSLAFVGCKPAETPREQARSVVLTVAEGVRAADVTCAAAAKLRQDARLAETCAGLVSDARLSLLAAEAGLDAWDAARAKEPACAVQSAAVALRQILEAVEKHGGKTPPAAQDALRLAPLLKGVCGG